MNQTDMDKGMNDQSVRMARVESDVNRMMTVLFGNPDIRARGMADKVDAIDARLSNIEGTIKRAMWVFTGVMLAGQGLFAYLIKVLGV